MSRLRLLARHCSARHSRHPPTSSAWFVVDRSAPHELRQLGARIDAQLGERIADVGFHRMKGKVQPGGDIAVGRAPRDQVDDLELGVGEAVPARSRPRLTDDAALNTERAQLPAYAARIGERL